MPGFRPAKAMVFAGVFPIDNADFPKLEESVRRLTLTDRSIAVQRESSSALGQGCRLGFLGTLHMDVFRQRLEDEYDASVIITAPTVPYQGASACLSPRRAPLGRRASDPRGHPTARVRGADGAARIQWFTGTGARRS